MHSSGTTPDTVSGAEPRWVEYVALALVLAAALGMRLWRLGEVPSVFFHDECDNTVYAIRILQGRGPGLYGLDWKPQPALAVHLIALSLGILGPGLAAVRLPSALLSVAALVPFYLLARRVTGPAAARTATVLLAAHPGYLHFSRAGWENVQVCLYTLAALEAMTRAESSAKLRWWILSGLSAAFAAWTYFAGRLVIVILSLHAAWLLAEGRGRGRPLLVGTGWMLLAFTVLLAPLYPVLRDNWTLFTRRSSAVFVSSELPSDATPAHAVAHVLRKGSVAARVFVHGAGHDESRYFPKGQPFFEPWRASLLILGLAASLRGYRRIRLWWIAMLLPFVVTQMLTIATPNLARGIALLPVAHLFVAQGLGALQLFVPHRRRVAASALLTASLLVAGSDFGDYLRWARSAELARALEPALQLREFRPWWDFQNASIRSSDLFFHVGMWKQLQGASAPERGRGER